MWSGFTTECSCAYCAVRTETFPQFVLVFDFTESSKQSKQNTPSIRSPTSNNVQKLEVSKAVWRMNYAASLVAAQNVVTIGADIMHSHELLIFNKHTHLRLQVRDMSHWNRYRSIPVWSRHITAISLHTAEKQIFFFKTVPDVDNVFSPFWRCKARPYYWHPWECLLLFGPQSPAFLYTKFEYKE
jgi:hypothetical protein